MQEVRCLLKVEEVLQRDEYLSREQAQALSEIVLGGLQVPGRGSNGLQTSEEEGTGLQKTGQEREHRWMLELEIEGAICRTRREWLHNDPRPCFTIDIRGSRRTYGRLTLFCPDWDELDYPQTHSREILLELISLRLGYFLETPSRTSGRVPRMMQDYHWKWRLLLAQLLAYTTNLEYYGIDEIYIIGSTKEANAQLSSDLDLVVHWNGEQDQKQEMLAWFEHWESMLHALYTEQFGHRIPARFLDYHIVTEEDRRRQTSYAVMIDSPRNLARLLRRRAQER
jgi:predicted nucleotidyltransferase